MWVILAILAVVVVFLICAVREEMLQQNANIERRKEFVASKGENTRIIVNDGTHLFFADDEKKTFGLNESGRTYSLSGLHGVSIFNDAVHFYHEDAVNLCIGKDPSRESTRPLNPLSVSAVAREMVPVLRSNLHKELEKENIVPTCEYEHKGEIWGCDRKAKKFYSAYGSFNIHDFSDFRYVTVDDVSDNRLCSSNYIMKVFVHGSFLNDTQCYDIYFDRQDATYYGLLDMFQKIRYQAQ